MTASGRDGRSGSPGAGKGSRTTRRSGEESDSTDSPLGARWDSLVRGRPDEQAVYRAVEQARSLAACVHEAPCPRVAFLVDECVTPLLAQIANDFGYEAHFIHHRGWGELKDPELYRELLAHDLTLITNNRDDWRDLLGRTELHPGLVVILRNAPRPEEIVYFARCLVLMATLSSMANTVVEVDEQGNVVAYPLPVE